MAATLSIDAVDMPQIAGLLADLERATGDLTPALSAIGQYGETSTRMRFERGVGPGGTPWPPSLRALREGGQTMVASSRLRDSLTHRASATTAEWGTNVIYAGIHQTGGQVRAKTRKGLRFRIGGQWVTVAAVEIPARPFLGIDEADTAAIAGLLRRHLARAGGGDAA